MSTECAIRRISDIRSHLNSDRAKLRVIFDELSLFPKTRMALAESFIEQGDFSFDVFDTLDVNLFLLKEVSPSQYLNQIVKTHLRSAGELYEYDPKKNGQNILKHGLSFGESLSFATNFGTMSVPLKEKGEERLAIFYELVIDTDHRVLEYPFPKWPKQASFLVMAIVANSDLPYRLISTRRISSKGMKRAVADALRAVEIDDPIIRSAFQQGCAERLSELLPRFA